jgi:Uma2 family endonuclease
MSALPKPRKLTVQEYLAIENAAALKSEFFDGEMFAMAGALPPHNKIKSQLEGEFYLRLKGSPCGTTSSDQRIKVGRTGLYTYPDIVIICGEPELDPNDRSTIVNPLVLIEVLSESTEHYDRTIKFDHYRKIDSAREYVLVSQDQPRVERYVRGGDDRWTHDAFVGLDATFSLESVPAKDISLADIYRGIMFPEASRP